MILEICVDSLESALAAEAGGANRVELCTDLHAGGTTPSIGMISTVCARLHIPVHVMIRPRSGDFTYSADELSIMRHDLAAAKNAGASGIVLGVLRNDDTVDVERTKEFIVLAKPLPVTFHRAFDITPDPLQALDNVVETGASFLLTSGQKATAAEGAVLIGDLNRRANGRITIIAGSGIGPGNFAEVIHETGVTQVHVLSSVCRVAEDVHAGLFRIKRWIVDAAEVAKLSNH